VQVTTKVQMNRRGQLLSRVSYHFGLLCWSILKSNMCNCYKADHMQQSRHDCVDSRLLRFAVTYVRCLGWPWRVVMHPAMKIVQYILWLNGRPTRPASCCGRPTETWLDPRLQV